jgi:superfamily I DNA/RNA helicase
LFDLTDAQSRFIEEASLESVLTACPGSGKTHTAVLRFIGRCKRGERGVAFLSYTNVAVDEAYNIAREFGAGGLVGSPNLVTTIDAFFRNFVFEPFIRASISDVPLDIEIFESRPPAAIASDATYKLGGINKMKVGKGVRDVGLFAWDATAFVDASGKPGYDYKANPYKEEREIIPQSFNKAVGAAKASYLKRGFATYNDILAFCYALIKDKKRRVAEIISHRFGEIIIDEAQDTSVLQQVMLQMLAEAGVKMSYVGDKMQGIYLFNKANPKYLDDLVARGHKSHALDVNFRSIESIVAAVNAHFGTEMVHKRSPVHPDHGAYVFVGTDIDAVAEFEGFLGRVGISLETAAIVVRSRGHMGKALALQNTSGWRSAPRHAVAAWQCERRGDTEAALRSAVRLIRDVSHPESLQSFDDGRLKELAWRFLRGGQYPQPSNEETLQEWCERLKGALQAYLESVGIKIHDDFGKRMAKNGLPSEGGALDCISVDRPIIRTTVVHQVKGETISAVLVIAPEKQHDTWLDAKADEEESNICYVAFTRAADLLVLHCPTAAYATEWRKRGFEDLPTKSIK